MVWMSPVNVSAGAERRDASLTILVSVGELNARKYGGRIWLCELQKGFLQYPDGFGDLDTNAHLESRMLPRLDKIIDQMNLKTHTEVGHQGMDSANNITQY